MSLGIILVDPQYDFFPGGSLAVTDGDQIVEPINRVLARHPEAPVFGTRDWHPENTRHFEARGGIWPPHCVQGTRGAAYHDELKVPDITEQDPYFEFHELAPPLEQKVTKRTAFGTHWGLVYFFGEDPHRMRDLLKEQEELDFYL